MALKRQRKKGRKEEKEGQYRGQGVGGINY